MQLKHPEYILGILVFALLLFLVSKLKKRKRSGLGFSSKLAVKKLPLIWRIIAFMPKILYLALAGTLLIALAAPFQIENTTETVIIGKIIVPSIDVSGSMSIGLPGGTTKLQVVKKILFDFLRSRSEVDSVGLTAFSGGGDGWGAGVIQYPTLSKELFISSAEKIDQDMFGGSTAIGEGIFMSILALNEGEWNKKLRQESGDPSVELDILRLWSAVNSLEIPEAGLVNAQPRSEDEAMISEIARLSPPETNKHKVIILFSDGDSNTGLDPLKPIWLASRLGIKVYYVEVREQNTSQPEDEFVPVANTPVPEHIKRLREMVRLSGGKFFAGGNYNDVSRFFNEISKLEKNEVAVKTNRNSRESYQNIMFIAAGLLMLLVIFENLFPSN